MTPIEASKKNNEGTVYLNLYGDMEQLSSKPKFKVGDKVRKERISGTCSIKVILQSGQKKCL